MNSAHFNHGSYGLRIEKYCKYCHRSVSTATQPRVLSALHLEWIMDYVTFKSKTLSYPARAENNDPIKKKMSHNSVTISKVLRVSVTPPRRICRCAWVNAMSRAQSASPYAQHVSATLMMPNVLLRSWIGSVKCHLAKTWRLKAFKLLRNVGYNRAWRQGSLRCILISLYLFITQWHKHEQNPAMSFREERVFFGDLVA